MVLTRTHGDDKDSWYGQGLMVSTRTHGIDNTHGNDWYRIGDPESHMYKRAECYPYAGYFGGKLPQISGYIFATKMCESHQLWS